MTNLLPFPAKKRLFLRFLFIFPIWQLSQENALYSILNFSLLIRRFCSFKLFQDSFWAVAQTKQVTIEVFHRDEQRFPKILTLLRKERGYNKKGGHRQGFPRRCSPTMKRASGSAGWISWHGLQVLRVSCDYLLGPLTVTAR